MGQIFYMTIYDPKTKECYFEHSDKFHANCYSCSRDVMIIHYLLRKKPYNVMWCGDYIAVYNNLNDFSSEVQLLGFSVTKTARDFKDNNEYSPRSSFDNKVKFIDENHDTWKKIPISVDEIYRYFDYEHTKSVKYDGYLINYTKKKAIDLKSYKKNSLLFNKNFGNYLVDLIPSLTETGKGIYAGTHMALFDGCAAEVSENLIGDWCGDLLEIVDHPPKDYEIIDCCFAPIWERAMYCEKNFGLDEEKFILKDENKNRMEVVKLGYCLEKCNPGYVKSFSDKVKISYEVISKNNDNKEDHQ